jgi:hypothetical protein
MAKDVFHQQVKGEDALAQRASGIATDPTEEKEQFFH